MAILTTTRERTINIKQNLKLFLNCNEMENLDTYKINGLGLKLQFAGDLVYYEKPLLSHFVDPGHPTEHYFYKWSDFDEKCNRWLIFKVTIEHLMSFFEGKLTLMDLIQKNQFVYFVDLDTDLTEISAFICPTQKIPDDYLPSAKSFFNESQYEKYALILKNELQKEAKSLKESEIMEVLLNEIVSIKSNQHRQDLLLNSILNNLNKKQLSE
jgi:hypothetical protein